MRNTITMLICLLVLASCQVREEIRFNADGSGTYEVGFDMSEMMKMNESNPETTGPATAALDTVINFATFLDEKRDSILTLSKAEQEKLEALRPLQFAMKMNDEEKQMDMRMTYAFTKLEDISKFADAVEKADIDQLNRVGSPLESMMYPPNEVENDTAPKKGGMGEIFAMSESFDTKFSKEGFSRKVTEKAIAEMAKKKDTAMKADDPFADMIRFKQVYRFPYRVKGVSNANAKILSDFKGIELEANMYEMNNDPEYFNVEVEFDR